MAKMPNTCEKLLTGTRSAVSEAAAKIQRELTIYGKTGHKDSTRHQLKYSFHILRSICIAASTPQGIHYDIYCDIFERVLAPCLQPSASPPIWGDFLENVRYLHHLLVNKKLFSEASRIYTCLAAQADKLQNETDYKPILATYSLHLLFQRLRLQRDATAAQKEIPHLLGALTSLFTTMLRCNAEQNFSYVNLMDVFVKCLCKQPAGILNFLSASLLEHKSQMHEALFALLVDMKIPQPQPDIELHCQWHLEAFISFMQLDVASLLQQQIALQHLRACCKLEALQSDKAIGYTINLLYYYLKFVYAQVKYNNFTCSYLELCGKFTNFFEKSSDILLQHNWFMDFVVAFGLLLSQTHQRATSCFEVFWQQMNCIECYVAHFELMLYFIKWAPRITESKLASWSCCSSVRKHTILSYAQSALGAYSYFLLNVPAESEQDKQQQNRLDDLNKTFTAIVRHAVKVINSMSCITDAASSCSPSSTAAVCSTTASFELKMFYTSFAQLTRDVKTPAQARYCVSLADNLEKLKTKFTAVDWTLLLRRIYKTAEISADAALTAELHSCYIAAMLQEAQKPELALLRSRIASFHLNPTHKCLLEWHAQCRSALKPELQPQQQRLLHWLETQHLFKYQKASEQLQLSLLRHCRTKYEHVLVVRGAKMQARGAGQLPAIREMFRQKGASVLSRLEQLTLAHACTQLLLEQRDVQKKTPDFETKDCVEDKMEDLLHRKELQCINVATEMEAIDLALEALHAFAAFYNKADSEHISSDIAYIDWESIVEDVAALALFLQFSGYLVHATVAWTLHYRICNTIEDQQNSLRALAYFCEHAEAFEETQGADCSLNLQREVTNKLPIILNCLQSSLQQSKRQQTQVLVCLCQLSYFYARLGEFSYSQMLLQLVKQQHGELPERQGKYDLVLSTMETVRMRILWKHVNNLRRLDLDEERAQVPLLQYSLLRELELTLDKFREFVYISSSDTLPYMILLFGLAQQAGECTANRLYDSHVNNILVSVLKIALHSGMALRIVQIMTTWMWTNLQMEYVAKAQTKLKIIECVLGVKNIRELTTPTVTTVVKAPLKKCTSLVEPLSALSAAMSVPVAAGVEAMRKVMPLQLSPIKVNKLQLSPESGNSDLKRFLNYDRNALLNKNEQLQWWYFAAGCLNARLHFLIDEYEQLNDFYEHCLRWLEQMKHTAHRRSFRHFQLLCLMHYANYLRAHKQHEKAQSILECALDKLGQQPLNLDIMYRLNLLLQLSGTEREIARKQISANEKYNRSQLRRSFEFNKSFNVSFDEERTAQTAKKPSQSKAAVCKLYASTTTKKSRCMAKGAPFTIYLSDDDAEIEPHTRKQLFQKKISSCSSQSSQSSQDGNNGSAGKKAVIDLYKSTEEDNLNLCQAIELIDLDDSTDACTEAKEATVAAAQTKNPPQTLASARTPKPVAAKSGSQRDGTALPESQANEASKLDVPSLSAKQSVAPIMASGAATSAKKSLRRKGRLCADLMTEVIVLDQSLTLSKASPMHVGIRQEQSAVALLKKMQALEVTETKAKTPGKSVQARARARKPPLLKQACLETCNSGNSPADIAHTTAATTITQPPKGRSNSRQPVASVTLKTPAATAPTAERTTRARTHKNTCKNNENIEPAAVRPAPATSSSSSTGTVTRRRHRT